MLFCDIEVLKMAITLESMEHTQKNMHGNFEIPLISKIFERYFTETFYHCFI